MAEITYHQMKHVNLSGFFCHGATKSGHKSRFSSHLSPEIREFIMRHLRLGLSIPQIMAAHRQRFMEVCERGEELTRDLFISEQDIRNVAGRLAIETYKRDNNDAKSVRMWVQEHPELVFYYKESGLHVRGAITRDNIPFTIGIQTSWQTDMMLKHGHKKAVSIDATFATNENKVSAHNILHTSMLRTRTAVYLRETERVPLSVTLQFPLYTLMVFDDWLNGVPVAYIITSSSKQPDLEPWMKALANKLVTMQRDWMPNAFITDCAQAEIGALQCVWPGVKVFLCLWHVRRAWLKQAVAKIKDHAIRAAVLKGLGRIMYDTKCPPGDEMGPWAIRQMTALMDRFPVVDSFWAYFNKQWADKTPMWVVGHRNLPYAGQDTNAAIESYHSNLKATLRASKGRAHGRRLDWVIYELTGEILSHYWYQAMRKQHGFVPNLKQEQFVINAVLKAREIPDSCVTLPIADDRPALVTSKTNPTKLYSVYNPDCEWGCCNCAWALKGNICKHQVKVLMILHPSLAEGTITRYCGSLAGTTEGGRGNMLDPVLHFPGDCTDSGPLCPTPSQVHPSCSQYLTQSGQDIEKRVRNLTDEFMDAASGDSFLLKHLLADLHIVRGKQQTLLAQIKHGLVEPSQLVVHFQRNEDGDMSLKRRKDFLERR